jgi:A/G-specific adenine glycosylase
LVNPQVRTLTGVESPIRGRAAFRAALLAWYDAAGRALPWRVRGALGDPYRVWLSEIMLQQTTVAAVTAYFERFIARWPRIADLAGAPDGDVMQAWAGLGYYSRARNLIATARVVAETGWPQTEEGLRALPGVGPYTAAAIAAIAFGAATNVVDGNVERVMARLFAETASLPGAKAALRDHAAQLVGPDRPGDYAQALMDLGATVCTPRTPKCGVCPVAAYCAGRAAGIADSLPRKADKPVRPVRHGVAFVMACDGRILVETRPPKGLLGGMLGLPTTPWREAAWADAEALALAPMSAAWRAAGVVRHVFTHFALELSVWRADIAPAAAPAGEWRAAEGLGAHLPTVFRKALVFGFATGG